MVYSKAEKQKIGTEMFLFRITLDIMYFWILQREYNNISILSLGYSRNAFSFATDPLRIIISYAITILFIIFALNKIVSSDKPHELLMIALLMISIFPNLSMFAYSDIEWMFLVYVSLFWIWFIIIVSYISHRSVREEEKLRNDPRLSKESSEILFWIIAIVFIVGSVVLSYAYYGRFYINLSFNSEDVYSSRLEARGAFSTITNYFRNNAMYVVIPLLANAFLIKKRYLLFASSVFVLILLFSVDSQKAVLMLAFVSMIAALFINKKICKTIVTGLLAVNVFVIAFYLIANNVLIIDYLVKRIYFLPAIIGRCHYEYVNSHDNVLFFSSLLQNIGVVSNYAYKEMALPFLIGRHYFGSGSISANTGGFAGAYVYGWIGMVFIPIIYAFLLKTLDGVTENIEPKYYIAFIVVGTFAINGATLTSVMFVYGFIVGLILLSIMNTAEVFERVDPVRIIFGRRKKL